IVFQLYWLGLALLLISRICDGVDGAVARINGKSDFGGYIDIVFDFFFYGVIPLAFIIADPAANAVAGGVLIFAFYANGASFLAFAIMAEKHGLTTDQRGEKSIFFTTGLAEATETIAVFVAFCLFPSYFAPIAYLFAVVCFYTTTVRIWQTKQLIG
ncbi:MAG: CDP-alcohol phosphatidyltransferase family protein, partial [Pseudomonadota bacterium]